MLSLQILKNTILQFAPFQETRYSLTRKSKIKSLESARTPLAPINHHFQFKPTGKISLRVEVSSLVMVKSQ